MLYINKKLIAFIVFIFIVSSVSLKAYENNPDITAYDNSSVLEQDVPLSIKTNQVYTMTVVMRNTGTSVWTKNENYHLQLFDIIDNMYPSDVWGIRGVYLPYDVLPLEKVTFIFNITAPSVSGRYNCRWSMAKNNEFFGETTSANLVDVESGGRVPTVVFDYDNNAEYVTQVIPSEMNAGQTYKILVTMRNTGKTVWVPTGDEFRLVYFNDNQQEGYSDWTSSGGHFMQTVEPGQESTSEFFITAPSRPGMYDLQWIMKRGNNYFGQKTDKVVVKVVNGNDIMKSKEYDSQFMEQQVPDEMKAHTQYNISITMINTGTKTWKRDYEKLVLTDARMSPLSLNSWNVGYVPVPEDVSPGELVTFNFNVKPEETGWQHFQFMMMNGEGKMFGMPSKSIEILVSRTK